MVAALTPHSTRSAGKTGLKVSRGAGGPLLGQQSLPGPLARYTVPGSGWRHHESGLADDLSNTTSASVMRPIVQKLVLATNAQLPMVTTVHLILVQWVKTSRLTDLPVRNGTLP